MHCVDTATHEVDESFARIANADLEVILKQLTQDEKIALLTGTCEGVLASTKHEKRG
jgi:beta-glucosidase